MSPYLIRVGDRVINPHYLRPSRTPEGIAEFGRTPAHPSDGPGATRFELTGEGDAAFRRAIAGLIIDQEG